LADIEVPPHSVHTGHPERAEEDVAGHLQQTLTVHDPLTLVGLLRADPQPVRQDGTLRLLRLQNQRIVGTGAVQQQHVRSRPDAAHSDQFESQLDHGELIEQVPTVALQSRAVGDDQI
jgi:hypothetical protein